MLEKRSLGKTGLSVTLLGLGGLFVSKVGGPFEQARLAIHYALEQGINYIDTAPGYLDSEEVLGKALCDVTQPLVLSTKLGGRPLPFHPQERKELEYSFAESLRLLGRPVDLLMIHEPDRPGQYDWWSDKEHFKGPVLNFIQELKAQGAVKAIGLGGTTAYELARIIRTGCFDVVLTAFNYSLLWREAEIEVLPAAIEQGMGIVIGSPLQQGALAKRYDAEIASGAPWLSKPRREQYRALYRLLDELQMPITEAAMRFIISNPNITTTLSGSRSIAELEQNLISVAKGPLPASVLGRLDEIAAMVPFRPFEEPFGLPFGRPYWGPGQA
ncbi:MAG: aldo/keto reductase [Chloroflexi bacterium]|nr:aldo/keto reductase [Chloroflexota bacterium]